MTNSEPARRTKIVATLGPASQNPDIIRLMIRNGLDVARLNFSHGTCEGHGEMIKVLKQIAAKEGRRVAVLQDLGGPKIRLGQIEEQTLEPGARVVLVPGHSASGGELPVNYPHLLEDVTVGARILLADGRVELLVTGRDDRGLKASVLVGGRLSSHKGVNLPTSDLRVSAFTEKDRRDLAYGLTQGVDFVAQSFVRHESDLKPLREMIAASESRPLLIAKIEKPQALARLERILEQVDGIMVARGDLGVEMPLEEVPVIQKRLIQAARRRGKIVITATQMLGSMVMNPRPSRAEVTDVANAILDGTDAVMLSDETAAGQYPVEAVVMLERVALQAEPLIDSKRFLQEPASAHLDQIGAGLTRAAAGLAHDLKAAAIVAATHSGATARLMSLLRQPVPLIGLTSLESTCSRLALSWGVQPVWAPPCETVAELEKQAEELVLEKGLAKPGDLIILTCGLPLNTAGGTNLIRLIKIAGGRRDPL